MNPESLDIAPEGSHHVINGISAYEERFDEVLKFHSPGLAPVIRGSKAWHIGPDGRPAYKRRFRRTFGFYENRAAVIGEDGWHHIHPSGKDAYPQRYAWCGNFQEGRCAVRDNDNSYFHITCDGMPVYRARWRYAGDYREGIAVIQANDGRSTHIDADGRQIHGQWFIDLDVFHKGFARARDEAGWTHVNRDGTPIYSRRFATVEPFYNGQARVERFDGAFEVIDEMGEAMVALRSPLRSEFAMLSGDMVGFWRTQTIATAVKLGVIESLPACDVEVAHECKLRIDAVQRLLRALGELSLVSMREGIWHLTARGEFLCMDHPLTLADAALEYAGPFSEMWASLPQALHGNGNAPDVFAEVARDERRCEGHHRMLQSYARHDYSTVPSALGLSGRERVIDAGGGLGVLANLMLDAHPHLQVTVLERPEVIARAMHEREKREGLAWYAGDLFEPWGIEADAVVLARVLHDWADAKASRILQNARSALPHGGNIYIVEMLVPETGNTGALCSLHLLLTSGGQERTAAEYGHLLNNAGFGTKEVRTLGSLVSVLVGVAQ